MGVQGDGFRIVELARMLSSRDVRRILKHASEVQLSGDISSPEPIESAVSQEDGTASESSKISQFTRLPHDLEVSLSAATGSSSQLIQCLIEFASQPEEFYSCRSKEQWLRTVVNCDCESTKNALLLFENARDFSENSDFRRHFTIQCIVVPCEPYWERLQRARSSKDNEAGATSTGVYFPTSSLGSHAFQFNDQQEYNILRDWVDRYANERDMIDETDKNPRRLRRKIQPSDGDLRLKALSSRENDSPGRFRVGFWRGGRFGVKVFKKEHEEIFKKEVTVLEAIGIHPHIVHSFGMSEPEGKDGYKYWMEKLDRDLDQFIIELSLSRDPPFPVIDSMDILLQIAKAMTRLHELNVIHGDLKSPNILISHNEVLGDVKLYIVKVTDFDNAQIIKSDHEVVHIKGTDEYIAPEVWKGRPTEDASGATEDYIGTPFSGSNAKKCDVYSFGIVAVEVLVGQISADPIQQDFDHDRRDDIMAPLEDIEIYHTHRDLIDLVAECLNHESSLRPSFEDVTTKLKKIIDRCQGSTTFSIEISA